MGLVRADVISISASVGGCMLGSGTCARATALLALAVCVTALPPHRHPRAPQHGGGLLLVVPLQRYNASSALGGVVPVYSYLPLQHNYLVPVHELRVLPLHAPHLHAHAARLTARDDTRHTYDRPDNNRYRQVYGGHGVGLQWGGRGAGHGFYVYG